MLVHSDYFFADNDLGDGAIVVLRHEFGDSVDVVNAKLTWLDWNYFEWEQVF